MLGDSNSNERQQRLGAAIAEYLAAVDSGQIDVSRWRAKHADLAQELDSFLQAQAQLANNIAANATHLDSDTHSEAMQSLPSRGQYIDEFEIAEELGRGGMGVVYRARQPALQRDVALKLLPAHAADHERQIRFRREAKAVAKLDHPSIAPIYDVGDSDAGPYFTMKLLTGGTLKQCAQTTAEFACAMAIQVADAVHHAHQRGVLHRDLKPSNVLLDESGRPCVSDFGLAKQVDDDDGAQSGVFLGTPAFMAPEQADGETTTRTDVYGIGAILYWLLTGRPPHSGATLAKVVEQIQFATPTPPRTHAPRTPRDLQTICMKCLSRSPSDRYGSAEELADDLRRWRDKRPIVARPTSVWRRLTLWTQRSPGSAALTCGLIVASVLAIAIAAAAFHANRLRTQTDQTRR